MKIAKLTLTPNRSTGPRRYSRIVVYRRGTDEHGDYLAPIRITDGKVEHLRFRDIRPSSADSELAEAWAAHVSRQAATARDSRVG